MVSKPSSMTHSEMTFNYKMLHPSLEATADLLCHRSHSGPYYAPGNEPLEAMIQQLVLIGSKIDRRKAYNADGIIRLCDFYDIEVLLLETAGRFQNKGTFILLAMLKSVADHFSRALPEAFQKPKLYFVQASGKKTSKKEGQRKKKKTY